MRSPSEAPDAHGDGVVVGSAVMRKAAEDPRPEATEIFVRTLASGLRPR